MKKIISIFLFLSISTLHPALQKHSKPLKQLMWWADQMQRRNNNEFAHYLYEQVANKTDNYTLKSDAYITLAIMKVDEGNPADSIYYFKKSLKYVEPDKKPAILSNLGCSYSEAKKFHRAEKCFKAALRINQRKDMKANLHYNLATLMNDKNMFEKAEFYYILAERQNDFFDVKAKATYDHGAFLYNQNKYLEALEYFKKAQSLNHPEVSLRAKNFISTTYTPENIFNLGYDALDENNNYAEKCFQITANQEKNEEIKYKSLFNLGILKLNAKKRDNAERYFRKIIQLNRGEYQEIQLTASKEINKIMIEKKLEQKIERMRNYYNLKLKPYLKIKIYKKNGIYKCCIIEDPFITLSRIPLIAMMFGKKLQ